MTGASLTLTNEMLHELVDDKAAAGAVRLMAFALLAADDTGVADFPPFHLRDRFAVKPSDRELTRSSERLGRSFRRLERWGLIDGASPTRITLASGRAA